MIIEIVEALKARTMATFEGRIAGAAEFAVIEPDAKLTMPCAYVILLDDAAEKNNSENGYSQLIQDSFAVIVLLSNEEDEIGKSSIAHIHPVRKVLNSALLLWNPDADHGPIEYNGGQLLSIDRARLYYQFEYSTDTLLDESDTWQGIENVNLPPFERLHIDVDTINPHDPNLGATGPDGRIEASFDVEIPQ